MAAAYPLGVHVVVPRTFSDFASWIARPLGCIATGVAMAIAGLAMCVSIVMFPVGVMLGLIGVAVLLCGLFAPPISIDA